MPIEVVEVDGKLEVWTAAIEYLQRQVLPGDAPLTSRTGWWWLAFDGETPVAFAGLLAASTTPGTAYLARAGVLRSHRGKGLQLRLIRARERRARQLGFSRMVTDTYSNPASANSLIRAGYKMFTPNYRWGFEGACYWQKTLIKPVKEACDPA